MADLNINLIIPDAHSARFLAVVDLIWPGRLLQNPVPTKNDWVHYSITKQLKEATKRAEKENQNITDIDIN